MSWLKKLKKSDKPSQHPPPLNPSPQICAGSSSINAEPNRGTVPGGALRSVNLETDRLNLIIAAGTNNGTTPGGNRGAESELRGSNNALGCAYLRYQADATGGRYKEESPLP